MARRVPRNVGGGPISRARTVRSRAAALGLPGVRTPNLLAREHSRRELRHARRSVLRMPVANSGALSDRRSLRRTRRGRGGDTIRRRSRGGRRVSSRLGTARGECHRHRIPTAARFDHDATAMAGSCLQPARHVRAAARLRHRRDGRLCRTLDRLPRIQAADRPGGDGIRRLQAACAARCMAWMASHSGYPDSCITGGDDCRHHTHRVQAASRDTPLPFGPYLAAAGLLVLYCGDTVNAIWLGFLAGTT